MSNRADYFHPRLDHAVLFWADWKEREISLRDQFALPLHEVLGSDPARTGRRARLAAGTLAIYAIEWVGVTAVVAICAFLLKQSEIFFVHHDVVLHLVTGSAMFVEVLAFGSLSLVIARALGALVLGLPKSPGQRAVRLARAVLSVYVFAVFVACMVAVALL